ncbi:transmembrane protein 138-domain-containing protein [Fimicolochytrium jonesii]|uniref:transmembrane protein 138-domain-containing protein n=1 Tax=Fimicolochytrium jonesii TaxID=1396493 RepID=UPI0022FDB133|nr:transmembrane protein 138-domain-containing protein [Fimicolochytrium jonesii]KAI8820743.1 transmembrane protein 138-domain-containing protein [Fimicolochytrium jonesii]
MSSFSVRSFYLTAGLQICLLTADLFITLFAEIRRHTFVTVVIAYLIQLLLFIANLVLLFLRFAGSYPFRAGMLRLMLNEFSATLWSCAFYAVCFFACRGIGLPLMAACNDTRCDFWTAGYVAVYTLFRFAEILYYFNMLRAAVQLCNPKYYQDSPWLRAQLRHAS